MQKKQGLILILLLLLNTGVWALEKGSSLPCFQIESGDEKILSEEKLQNKIIFFFYDHKDLFQRNNEYKAALFREYKALKQATQDSIRIVQVIDCTEANFLNSWIYRKGLIRNSEKYGFRIWGDWDGNVKRNFGFKDLESYMLVFDRHGKLVYTDQQLFEMKTIETVIELINNLFEEYRCR